jgi:hypothetical protein
MRKKGPLAGYVLRLAGDQISCLLVRKSSQIDRKANNDDNKEINNNKTNND